MNNNPNNNNFLWYITILYIYIYENNNWEIYTVVYILTLCRYVILLTIQDFSLCNMYPYIL